MNVNSTFAIQFGSVVAYSYFLFCICKKILFPEKWVWILGFGILLIQHLFHFLYSLGGKYIILYPAFFWVKTVFDTIGVLSLIIGTYSSSNKGSISPHWYSLPQSCTPLSLLAQYFPSAYLAAGLTFAFSLYSVAFTPSFNKKFLPGLVGIGIGSLWKNSELFSEYVVLLDLFDVYTLFILANAATIFIALIGANLKLKLN